MSDSNSPTALTEPVQLGSARDELRRIGGLIFDARRHIGAGQAINIVGLESLIRTLCTAAHSLPADEGRELRPDLEAILYDLDALATELAERYGDLARREGLAPPGNLDAYRGKN